MRIDYIQQEEGALMLLRRAGLASLTMSLEQTEAEQRAAAFELVHELHGVSLALEQAGTYISETGCTIQDYLQLYHERVAHFSNLDMGIDKNSITILVNFDILLTYLTSMVGRALLASERQRYGLQVFRVASPLILSLDEADSVWSHLLIVHIQPLAQLDDAWLLACPEAAEVFTWAASVLREQKKYEDAELLLEKALKVCKHIYEGKGARVATALSDLAAIKRLQGNHEDAGRFALRAHLTKVDALGPEHPDTILTLCDLGHLYTLQGKWEEAETLFQRALTNCEHLLTEKHPITVQVLSYLTVLYEKWAASSHDEPEIETAKILHKLALVSITQEKWEPAEAVYQKILPIYEKNLEEMYPDMLQCLDQLTFLAMQQEKSSQAEISAKRALAIREQMLGPKHPDIAANLNSMAATYLEQERFEEAEQVLQRALTISTDAMGSTHPTVAMSLGNLATAYMGQGKNEQAIITLKQVLLMWEQNLGKDDPQVASLQKQYRELEEFLQS